ncbi:hypothetical protein J6O48_09475 [bacterium]|nr:hypothetical protein [bacterium]
MEICDYCRRLMFIQEIVAVKQIKIKEIQQALHLSKSVVSRHLTGEINKPEIDIFIFEKLLGVRVRDYIYIDD